MAASPEGRKALGTLIASFLVAHGVGDIVLEISDERMAAFAADLDSRLSTALLTAASRKEIAIVTRAEIISALDTLFEVDVPRPGAAN
jgi:hypothetical protein